MKRILISHNDLDGHGVVVLAKYFKKYLQLHDIIIEDYSFEENEETLNYIKLYDEIIIADLSFPEETYLELIKLNKKVSIFDHHTTTEWISKYEGSKWDESKCGTKIFWEEFVKPKINRYKPIIDDFVKLVDTYDRWQQDHELWNEAKKLNSVIYGLRNFYEIEDIDKSKPFYDLMIKKFNKLNNWRWTDKELDIIRKADLREKEMLDEAKANLQVRKDSKGYTFGVCRLPSKISLVASEILKQRQDLVYLVIANTYKGMTGKISFRSRDGFDCTEIAVANGHKGAAAATITEEEINNFWDNNISFSYEDEYNRTNNIFRKVV
jgi:oligoribonuclease NrnB/cAMP/cGMP phosphodiesterase (DHH superfamily)